MIESDILNAGYHEYDPTPIDHEDIDKRYQKRFDDKIGKKYFIDIIHWKPIRHPHTGEWYGGGYEFETQLYKKGTHEPINMTFFSGWDIDSVEKFISDMFDTGILDYYEEFDSYVD